MAKKRPLTSPAPLYRIEQRLTPKARAAFQAAVKQWQKDVAAGKPPNPQALKPLVKVTQDGTRLAGTAAAAQIAGLRPGLSLAFDLTNAAAVKWAKQNAARLITNITNESAAAIRNAVARSMRGEFTVQEIARFVRGKVGLTVGQEDAVQRLLERALDEGLSRADALAESGDYAAKLLRYRSEVIARTEVLMAENRGQELLWEQGKASGALKGLVRMWLATPDELLCLRICAKMDGQTTPIGEPWTLPDGELSMDDEPTVMTPQSSHSQCRCSEGLVEAR